mmetsp:Transcript_9822/g.36637  ORF Transcript_9822/g.36637 Transcript_9822/m.36637 type:complete len:266 (-) Transcript_9822:45-842(-)|eukprot:CAMPEP_0117439006 /NCGR_PEP_ID=MMETSP0759-20121206/2347_1 /TAXON_ID=63605 /ORGANISM="Percolomonas cosmopolitus, Strain WS" /LENGTH=265 /DNA_ID=CAMNT_0005230717 /DNA_START=24 /DNA_END=821 /DNA_ORIENTATION=-
MDQTDENRSKLQYALRIIQETFEKQTNLSQEESSKWKTQCILQKKQITQLEEELKQSHSRMRQLEKLVKEANDSRNVVFRKFNALKKKYDQLSKFKSSIEHMLHGGSDAALGRDEPGLDAGFDDLGLGGGTSMNLDTFRDELRNIDGSSNNYNDNTSSNSPNHLDAKYMASGSPSANRDLHSSSFDQDDQHDDSNAVEAKTLYSQVKQALNAHQFKQFAANIRQLNSGQQSVDETLQNIQEIFGSERQHLYLELERLVKSSAQEG